MKPKHTPSPQQANFYDWVTNEKGSCVLTAVAGAGKTTTLIEALELMKGKIFFGAYNKKIADEIASRAGSSCDRTVSTFHAAGLRAWKKVADKFFKVEADKCRAIFRAEVARINPLDAILEGPVLQLVSLAKQAAVGVISDVEDRNVWLQLIKHFNIEVFDERSGDDNTDAIIEIAKHVFFVSAERCRSIIDFDDMIFAPLYFNVAFDQYDWVLVDEAQDLNASRREMSLRMLKPGGRLVAVGDPHQAIYGFTGADADSLDLISASVNAVQLPLTTTFRCPKAVVKYAQQWVSHIHAAETAPEGIVRAADISTLHAEVKIGDAILCRFNAPLIKNVYSLIAKGIPARVEGREIGAGLKVLANRWKVKTIDALLLKLDTYLEREVKKYEAKENHRAIEAVTDKVQCLRVIIDRVIAKGAITQPPQLAVIAEIDAIFGVDDKNDTKPVVILSSVHKSKGKEWSKVVWLQTGPSPFAKLDWQLVQESNLCYVAATRAMHELVLMQVTKESK